MALVTYSVKCLYSRQYYYLYNNITNSPTIIKPFEFHSVRMQCDSDIKVQYSSRDVVYRNETVSVHVIYKL